jgi:hypothetical protein
VRAGESCQRFVLLESLFRLTHKRPPVRYLAHISSLRYVYVHFCYTVSKAYAYIRSRPAYDRKVDVADVRVEVCVEPDLTLPLPFILNLSLARHPGGW